MSNLQRLMMALGYQGGTLAQAVEITGCDTLEFLDLRADPRDPMYQVGLSVGCGFRKDLIVAMARKMKGEKAFWSGVIDSTIF